MQLFAGGEELANKKDIINPNLAYGYVRSVADSTIVGTVKDFTFTADNSNNYCFYKVPINLPIRKGDAITISAFATLSGPQAADGLYKATIYDTNIQATFDDTADTVHLKSGIRSSKTIFANRDSDPNDPPVLFIYSGVAGKTNGNTIHVQEVKVERGTVATPWCPAYEDYVMKSDYGELLDHELGIGNLLTDDEMNIANALKNPAAQGAISNMNYSNGVSYFHYRGTTDYERINWPFQVSPNTNYRMEIVVNSTNELVALDNTQPYVPWGINSKEDLTAATSGDIGNWHLPLPWSKEISGSITFNSGNYSKLYLFSNLGFTTDMVDTDITLQIKLFRNDSIQTQIDQLRSQIEQLKQK